MHLKYQRDHAKSLEQDIEDIRNNVPTKLVYVGHDDNTIQFLDVGVEENEHQQYQRIAGI